MAAYIPIPRDLSKIKSKVVFNLTRRQLICFGIGAAVGLPIYFLIRNATATSVAAFVMIITMLPFFLLAMYERNGQPLEVVAMHFIETKVRRSKNRPYRTNNYYALLMRQAKTDKEVMRIVRKAQERTRKKR